MAVVAAPPESPEATTREVRFSELHEPFSEFERKCTTLSSGGQLYALNDD